MNSSCSSPAELDHWKSWSGMVHLGVATAIVPSTIFMAIYAYRRIPFRSYFAKSTFQLICLTVALGIVHQLLYSIFMLFSFIKAYNNQCWIFPYCRFIHKAILILRLWMISLGGFTAFDGVINHSQIRLAPSVSRANVFFVAALLVSIVMFFFMDSVTDIPMSMCMQLIDMSTLTNNMTILIGTNGGFAIIHSIYSVRLVLKKISQLKTITATDKSTRINAELALSGVLWIQSFVFVASPVAILVLGKYDMGLFLQGLLVQWAFTYPLASFLFPLLLSIGVHFIHKRRMNKKQIISTVETFGHIEPNPQNITEAEMMQNDHFKSLNDAWEEGHERRFG